MCGRYTLSRTEEIRERFGIQTADIEPKPRFNVCPEQTMPVIVSEEPAHLLPMQWGLVPSWSKEPKNISINARIEGILSKPSFRQPIRFGRCLIPACGFYEWKKEVRGKVPHHIRRKDGGLFAFAGLYDTWKAADGIDLRSFAILTTASTSFMAQIHNRMPVILTAEQETAWLTTEASKTERLLSSLPIALRFPLRDVSRFDKGELAQKRFAGTSVSGCRTGCIRD